MVDALIARGAVVLEECLPYTAPRAEPANMCDYRWAPSQGPARITYEARSTPPRSMPRAAQRRAARARAHVCIAPPQVQDDRPRPCPRHLQVPEAVRRMGDPGAHTPMVRAPALAAAPRTATACCAM